MQQFVYCVRRHEWQITNNQGLIIVVTIGQLIKWCIPLLSALGLKEFCKFALKLSKGDKAAYFHQENKRIHSYGIITFGYCKLYAVGEDDAVIGPVNTLPEYRGKGLATTTLKAAVNWLFTVRNCSAVYIDTSEANNAMQHVIKKSGFSEPISQFTR